MISQPRFLPISRTEIDELGFDQLDVIIISGDAYVDHPSFGTALLGRVLWSAGYTVGVIPQPNWRDLSNFRSLGSPRLFFGVTSGNVDSMVNNFTAALKRRKYDVYSPKGRILRPDRATLVYAEKIHSAYPEVPIVLGGIEASLRRFAHYDYWSDSVRRSALADAPADMIVFGMGESAIKEVARRLDLGEKIGEIRDVRGTVVKEEVKRWRQTKNPDWLEIPSYDSVANDVKEYAHAFSLHYKEQDPFFGRVVVQPHPKTVIVQNPPSKPLSSQELDAIYELPYARTSHPSYTEPISALEPVRFSVTSHRGCFGSCSFCALTHHQGRVIQSRSIESLVREVKRLTDMPGFKGVIQDVGGPTANMYGAVCNRPKSKICNKKSCMGCKNLELEGTRYLDVLRKIKEIPGVKHVFVSSGLRHDLLLLENTCFLAELCRHHISGHLKIAPEHTSSKVTKRMNKPPSAVLDAFLKTFANAKKSAGKDMYVLPYFMSGHPGCSIEDMIDLALYIRDHNIYVEQVQDFTPTPMTVSTTMYHTGLDPFTGESIHVPKGKEKRIQRAILSYRDKNNYNLVRDGLEMANRYDLIGNGPDCLIPSIKPKNGRTPW